MKQKSNYIIGQINSAKNKKYEIAIIVPLLTDIDLLCLCPYTQYPVTTKSGKQKYIDLYYEQIQLAIEVCEPFHEYQVNDDSIRKDEIDEILKCDFYEISIDSSFVLFDEIKKLKKRIIEKIDERKNAGSFTNWEIPFHTMEQVAIDYPKSISVNADNFALGALGPISINEKIRENADTLIVYSGDTITKVYDISSSFWTECDDKSKGYIHNGIEMPNHPLLASGATNWNITTNRFLGNDIKKYSSYRKYPKQTNTIFHNKGTQRGYNSKKK